MGINEISPHVLTSPAPMKIPEQLWTLSTSLFLRKGMGNIPCFYELNKCNSFFFTVINKCKKSGKKGLSLTLLQLLFRRLFSLDGGTKPLCGISLEVSSFPQRRKCTSQVTYNFLVRQSDVRTPSRVLAMTAPWDSYYNQPDWVEGSASPSRLYQRVWLWAVTGCGYRVPFSHEQPQSTADLCVP